jgi:type I restriction enzyme, R subunit
VLYGPGVAAGEPAAERTDPGCRDTVLERRLRHALSRLNTYLPADAIDEAYRKLLRSDAPSLVERNRIVYRLLVDGVPVEYRRTDGSIAGAQARVIDFDIPDNTGIRRTSRKRRR